MAKNNLLQKVLVAVRRTLRIENKANTHMKRYNNLYDQICTRENLYMAYLKARKGKARTSGVRIFEADLENNLEALYCQLVDGKYKTSEYDVFTIYEPKERLIYRLPFQDRVLHHAIMNVLEPIWVPIFIRHTYSCIKGRGIHAAVRDIHRDLKDIGGTQYCLKIDIRKFYPTVDHVILKNILRKKIKDNRLLDLLDGIIDSAEGLPIGNYLSQFFANLYLSYFDHWAKEVLSVRYYYRYADDIVVLAPDKPSLHKMRETFDRYLTENLHLQIKGNYQIFPVDVRGIDFVGYVFRHTHTLMRKSIKKSLCRRAATLNRRNMDPKAYKQQISPYIGWAGHCNSKHLIKKVIDGKKIL